MHKKSNNNSIGMKFLLSLGGSSKGWGVSVNQSDRIRYGAMVGEHDKGCT